MQNFDIDELLCCGKAPSQEEMLPAEFRSKFQLGKVYQLGLAVPSVVDAAKRLEAKGVGPFMIAEDDLHTWIERGEKKSFHGKLGMAFLGGFELELLEAGIGSTIYSEKFRPDGLIALHHLGFLDHRLDYRIRQFNDAGIETYVKGTIKLGPLAINVAYMDSRKEAGTIVEFIDYRLFGMPINPTPALIKAISKFMRLIGVREIRMGKRG